MNSRLVWFLVLVVASSGAAPRFCRSDDLPGGKFPPATKPGNSPADKTQAPAAFQDLLFCGAGEPLLIRLQIAVGEPSFEAHWRAGLAKSIAALDQNQDGLLSREETKTTPTTPDDKSDKDKSSKAPPIASALLKTTALWEADEEPRDDQLTLDEIARYLMRRGEGPFQTESASDTEALLTPQLVSANNAGQRLFDWLDGDDNQTLSVRELRTAVDSLNRYDLDADESISLNELQGVENPFFFAQRPNQTTATPFFAVPQGRSSTRVVRQLMQRYGGPAKSAKPATLQSASVGATIPPPSQSSSSSGVSVETFSLPKPQAARFDRDQNGLLDDWELREYLKAPAPTVTIQVPLALAADHATPLTGRVLKEGSKVTVNTSPLGSVSIMAGDVQIEIDANGLEPDVLQKSLEERFRRIDGDNNGYLEQAEANRDTYFRGSFKSSDADKNGKLYPEEWQPPVKAALEAAAARTRLTVTDAGQDLFTVLDADRNLKISPREWQTAADRLATWDKNSNGTLDSGEVPHMYRVSLGPGLPDLTGLLQDPSNNNNQADALAGPRMIRGPKWFQAMDKNADGDVSAREFLGKLELFRTMDQDQNGLLDPTEAARLGE